MKKLSILLAGLCVAASVSAQAANTNVTSVNMVGFVNANLLSNQLHFAAINMNSVGGSNSLFTTVLGDQLPGSSWVYFWNTSSQMWDRAQKRSPSKGGWGAATNRTIAVGEGIFILSTSNMTINLAGEVPLSTTSTVSLVAGYNAIGYMYPVDTWWTNSVLADGLPGSSWLNVWDDNTGWARYQKRSPSKGGWGGATNLVLHPGQGFFVINSGGATNFSEPRPFTP